MSRDRQSAGWPDSVIAFIRQNLPGDGMAHGWDHRHITAYQIGCEALAALGQAVETGRGARPLAHPRLPEVLPRWDDICVAVLKLARQQDLLSYRLPDGRRYPNTPPGSGGRQEPRRPRTSPPPSGLAPPMQRPNSRRSCEPWD
ncbi:hypothetical protein KTN05_16980 [Paracoccus sp. Z118]|uniref:hypothetical protein n=1 Tax=Paracoccus sp. Z118 TaxID=2851017 RepID=UPI001C2BF800|nr:hypothetical protein [Paracoccus sp. Z118]MBV0893491.1 hypothetical protein [Paracoccus sp. Z118]